MPAFYVCVLLIKIQDYLYSGKSSVFSFKQCTLHNHYYDIIKYILIRFPKDPKRLKIWLFKCGLIESDVQSNRKLCSFHFAETDFGKGVKKRSLKSNAIPTIFEENHLRQKTPSTAFEGHAFLCNVIHL